MSGESRADARPSAGASPAAASERAAGWLDAARWAGIAAAAALPLSPPAVNIALGVMLIVFLGSGEAGPRLRHALRQPLALGALAVLAVAALGTLWADVPWSERWDGWWSWRKLLVIPLLLALFGELRWKRRLAGVFALVCGAGALASFAVALGWVPGLAPDRAAHLMRNHGTQGMALAVAALCALWLATTVARTPWQRAGWLALALLHAASALLVTTSRSGHLALLIVGVVFAIGGLGRRRAGLAAVAVAAIAALPALSPTVRERAAQAIAEWRDAGQATELTSFGMRAVMYGNTVQMIRERPWFGVGTGGFEQAYARQIEGQHDDWRATVTDDPHNQYLRVTAELGVFGLLVFLGYIAAALVDRGDGTSARRVAVAILLAWCATSLFSSHFGTFAEGHLLAIFLGVMLARPYPGGAAVGT